MAAMDTDDPTMDDYFEEWFALLRIRAAAQPHDPSPVATGAHELLVAPNPPARAPSVSISTTAPRAMRRTSERVHRTPWPELRRSFRAPTDLRESSFTELLWML